MKSFFAPKKEPEVVEFLFLNKSELINDYNVSRMINADESYKAKTLIHLLQRTRNVLYLNENDPELPADLRFYLSADGLLPKSVNRYSVFLKPKPAKRKDLEKIEALLIQRLMPFLPKAKRLQIINTPVEDIPLLRLEATLELSANDVDDMKIQSRRELYRILRSSPLNMIMGKASPTLVFLLDEFKDKEEDKGEEMVEDEEEEFQGKKKTTLKRSRSRDLYHYKDEIMRIIREISKENKAKAMVLCGDEKLTGEKKSEFKKVAKNKFERSIMQQVEEFLFLHGSSVVNKENFCLAAIADTSGETATLTHLLERTRKVLHFESDDHDKVLIDDLRFLLSKDGYIPKVLETLVEFGANFWPKRKRIFEKVEEYLCYRIHPIVMKAQRNVGNSYALANDSIERLDGKIELSGGDFDPVILKVQNRSELMRILQHSSLKELEKVASTSIAPLLKEVIKSEKLSFTSDSFAESSTNTDHSQKDLKVMKELFKHREEIMGLIRGIREEEKKQECFRPKMIYPSMQKSNSRSNSIARVLNRVNSLTSNRDRSGSNCSTQSKTRKTKKPTAEFDDILNDLLLEM